MSMPLKIKARDDRHTRTLKIAYNSILKDAEALAEYANRYHISPDIWPDLKSKHDRYLEYIDAMNDIEEMLNTRQGVFNI